MAAETQTFIDMMKKFGSDLGLPKVDVDKLVESHRKNLEALSQAALVASEGAKSLAAKQKEMVEEAFRNALDTVREFKPTGDAREAVAKQTELARKAFELDDQQCARHRRTRQEIERRRPQDHRRQDHRRRRGDPREIRERKRREEDPLKRAPAVRRRTGNSWAFPSWRRNWRRSAGEVSAGAVLRAAVTRQRLSRL